MSFPPGFSQSHFEHYFAEPPMEHGIRVENLGANVSAWCKKTGEGSTTYDLCVTCHAELLNDPHSLDNDLTPQGPGEPQGEDGYGGDVEHPSYNDTEYNCTICGTVLMDKED